jgi:hypothetical protein
MRNFELEIWDDEGRRTTFYTVKKEGTADSETDAFFLRFESDPKFREAALMLLQLILESIGNEHGAHEAFFRFEGAAVGLPPPRNVGLRRVELDFTGFPLRLYCLRIAHGLVVLMGGGIKTSQKAQDSPDLKRPLAEAVAFVKAIDLAIKERYIQLHPNGRGFLCDDETIVIEW